MPQSSAQLVDIAAWSIDEDFPIFPVGSKPKRLLRCPDDAPQPFLIPGHSYLFKVAHDWRAQQLWSEVIAYRIAASVGLEVPPCFVAVDSQVGEVGALVEFFTAIQTKRSRRGLFTPPIFCSASELGRVHRPHFIRLNLSLCRALGLASSVEWWARVMTFDALIGNSDRHPENWGFLNRINRTRGEGDTSWAIAPAFDNGTSLGYEIREERTLEFCNSLRLEPYVDNGHYHCGWITERPPDAPYGFMPAPD